MIGIGGSIMSMYTDSVMVLLVTRQCFAPVKDTHQATAVLLGVLMKLRQIRQSYILLSRDISRALFAAINPKLML